MVKDQQGNLLSGANARAAADFDAAVEAFNLYRGDPVALLDRAVEAAPDFAMAHILKAYLFALATEPEAAEEARSIVARLEALALSDREKRHVSALKLVLAGEWSAAATTLDRLSMEHPHDLVALQAGHLMDFYRANARNLRDRIARALPAWDPERPGYSILLGCYAFGLEECGDYDRAEAVGREAVARQPLDCWAHHAVAHVMEMQGRSEDGLGWMLAREPYWSGEGNFFQVHNWWHRALFHLDLGDQSAALALYDERIRADRSGVALDLVDASALLWRLQAVGCDVGARWEEVAQAWEAHADGVLYPFNDWHAAMAFLGAGRGAEVERLLAPPLSADALESETGAWARTHGRPLIEGFKAFSEGRYADGVEHLYGARAIANAFGGSHAQRDVIDWTLIEAALRAGLFDMAQALAQERLAAKPHSPINCGLLERAHTGRTQAVAAA